MSGVKKGDRVHVEFDGVVRSYDIDTGGVMVEAGRHRLAYVSRSSVRVIEPEYELGAVYVDAAHTFWRYQGPRSWTLLNHGNKSLYGHDVPVRPLKRLVEAAD